MARAYYGQERNRDVPVPAPDPATAITTATTTQETLPPNRGDMNLKGLYFNPLDIPPNWKPGGVAANTAKEISHVSPKIQTTEEED
tara:strand:+ start:1294 stop:1551 length:258 start_codon:yes stop_codon:yes gene_type:complete